jgi:hypothetical protein
MKAARSPKIWRKSPEKRLTKIERGKPRRFVRTHIGTELVHIDRRYLAQHPTQK